MTSVALKFVTNNNLFFSDILQKRPMGKHGQGKPRNRSKSKQNNARTDMSSEKKEVLSSTFSNEPRTKRTKSVQLRRDRDKRKHSRGKIS